jgi:hypothetical protein
MNSNALKQYFDLACSSFMSLWPQYASNTQSFFLYDGYWFLYLSLQEQASCDVKCTQKWNKMH